MPAAILTVLDSGATPLRPPLGDDGVDAVLGYLDSVRRGRALRLPCRLNKRPFGPG
jgi:hypothetical protein